MHLSEKGLKNIVRGLKRSWVDGTHRKKQKSRIIDADTLRNRAAYDRKGKFIVSVSIYHGVKNKKQYDVFSNNKFLFTSGPRNFIDNLLKTISIEN